MKKLLLFGNPNVGKTSVFNGLTDSNAKVSNFDGATIEKKSAISSDNSFELIDVPGTNSLSGNMAVERVSYQALTANEADIVIDVIDITNLKRNLYLLVELLESKNHVNVIINMMDAFTGDFDAEKFSKVFNVNAIIANRQKTNIDSEELLSTQENNFQIDYGTEVETAVLKITNLIDPNIEFDSRFIAIQLLKGNQEALSFVNDQAKAKIIMQTLEEEINELGLAKSINGLFFVKRKEFFDQVIPEMYTKKVSSLEMKWMNEKFDQVALHKFWGYILFAAIMYLVFVITYQGGILQDFVDGIMSTINGAIGTVLTNIGVNDHIVSFIVDGALAGVAGVLVFIPQIIIMFTLLTVLESIGYFSRVTVLFERIFDKLGLSSHSMIPYISGLGCNVIGIMSTRTIKDEKKRIATILTSPFISCSARLPIYLIFVDVFFEGNKGLVLFMLYFLGIFVAIFSAFIIDKLIFKTKNEITVFTLPTYKSVDKAYVLRSVRVKLTSYVKNAGKFILYGSMIIWFLTNIGFNGFTDNIDESFLGMIASSISFVFAPLGFGTTEAVASLLSGFLAKELAVSSMIVMYSTGSISGLSSELVNHFDSASAMSFMVFSLLYVPCLATLGAIYSELKQIKYVFYAVGLSLTMGYLFAFIIYTIF